MFFGVTGLGCLSEEVAFVYDFSFCDLAGIRGGIEKMRVSFTISLPLLLFVDLGTCGVNLDFILFLKIVLALFI